MTTTLDRYVHAAVIVQTATFRATGLTRPMVEEAALRVFRAQLEQNQDITNMSISVTATESRRLEEEGTDAFLPGPRRLAGIWTTVCVVKATPLEGVTALLSTNALTSNTTALAIAIQNALVATGANATLLSESFVLSSITAPSVTVPYVPGVVSCGSDFCPLGYQAKVGVSVTLCQSLTCEEASSGCCGTAAPASTVRGASTSWIAGLIVALALVVAIIALLVTALRQPTLFRYLPRRVRSHCGCLLKNPKMQPLTEMDSTQANGQTILSSPELDMRVLELLLNDLQGDWRLWDQDKQMPGIISVQKNGRTLYDEMHYDTQDLQARPGGIARPDGWYLDLQRSTSDTLVWLKNDEVGVNWRRCQGVSAFAVGDTVEWAGGASEVPAESQGTVTAFSDNRVWVKFKEQSLQCKPSQLIALKAKGPGADEAELSKNLPSLTQCIEFKRLSLYADAVGKENTGLVAENENLRKELGIKLDRLGKENTELSRENTRLRAQLVFAEDIKRELTNSLVVGKENTALSLENERLRARLSQADILGQELTELSLANNRLGKQLQDVAPPKVPANSPRTHLGPPGLDAHRLMRESSGPRPPGSAYGGSHRPMGISEELASGFPGANRGHLIQPQFPPPSPATAGAPSYSGPPRPPPLESPHLYAGQHISLQTPQSGRGTTPPGGWPSLATPLSVQTAQRQQQLLQARAAHTDFYAADDDSDSDDNLAI